MLFGPQLFVALVVVSLLFVVLCAFCVALVFFFFSCVCNGRRETETVVATAAGGHKKERDETSRGDATRCVGSALVSRFTVRKQLFSFFLFIYFFRRDFN